MTLAKLPSPPITMVRPASKMEECASPTMSMDTMGSVWYSKMPASGPSAAAFIAALIASTVAGFSSSTVRSTIEPSGVGTRVAKPSSLPLSSGSTSDTARAAPVVVGIMDMAAARARRRSLCGRSRIFWSLV